MIDFLAFRLYGPFVAWGEVAPGDVRSTTSKPTRSALLGLVAAALGLRRHDNVSQQRLADSAHFAVRIDAPGVRLIDFHTTQWRLPKRKELFSTRRDEVEGDPNPVLSSRHYLVDAAYTVLLWLEDGRFDLDRLADALRRPRFVLFLGRKACPLAHPLVPTPISAPTLREAFHAYDGLAAWDRELRAEVPGWSTAALIYWDADSSVVPGLDASQTQTIRDQPLSRDPRRFALRREAMGSTDVPVPTDPST